MERFDHAHAIDGWRQPHNGFIAFCDECDEEILGEMPCYYEADGEYDADGGTRDCSTYLCEPCGATKEVA